MDFILNLIKNSYNEKSLYLYFLGVCIGAFIVIFALFLIYLINFKRKKPIGKERTQMFSEDELQQLIKQKQDKFVELAQDKNPFPVLANTLIPMVEEIARKFYPDCKRPLLELNSSEALSTIKIIVHVLQEKIEDLHLNFVSRKVTISFIVNQVTKHQNKAKEEKKPNIFKRWFSKNSNLVLNKMLKKFFFATIETVGQEVYNIYSKKSINQLNAPNKVLSLPPSDKKAG